MVAPLLQPDAPSWAQRFAQRLESVFLKKSPTAPVRLWGVVFAELPPAADWTGCLVYVTDKAKAGLSNGTTWTDAAGGAL